MKGCDAFKIVQVEETASACTARVLKPLDCAHKVAMECSQWKQSPGAMQRVSKLRTVHPRNGMAGHSFFLRLCSSTTRLQTVIKGTQRVLSDKSLTLYVVEYSQQAGLSRSEAEVAGTIQRRHRFELKTLNEENFLRIAGSEKAHVVFGHLYSAKYLINPTVGGREYEKGRRSQKVACRRVAKAARRKGFGNARAVRKLFEVKKLVRISDENYARELKRQETVPQKTKPYFGNASAVEQ
ncbi:hypothetical protein PC113_g18897 [Phytophthora cactorum]|uniref:Uncharacterized protein n=1 Tax=Phytophthora cactorum TaxID=29920 RepID=A0A8T0YAU8_9STRA|nr:hypothetical protein PC113_g18897 [Phytophthora cactorum]